MAGGKLTPRQKMINMMYLVLTALLALNVSKEIINAFVTVNESLEVSKANIEGKNAITYDDFKRAMDVDALKYADANNQAQAVKKASEEMTKHIEAIKEELVRAADKVDQGAPTPDLRSMEDKENYDIPTHIMCGPESDGKGFKATELKKKIEEYKATLIKNLPATLPESEKATFKKQLDDALNTKDPEPSSAEYKQDNKRTWEMSKFYHNPVVATAALLTKFQGDIRNAESRAIDNLYASVNKNRIIMDQFTARQIPNSTVVTIGNEYIADVFLSATSATLAPEVFIGATYDSIGKKCNGCDGKSLPQEGGIAKYTARPSSEGPQKWGGVIRVKKPDNTFDHYPFNTEYIAQKPNSVVSADKMNVLYIGVDNPMSISVPGVPNSSVRATIEGAGGSLKPDPKLGGGHYIATVLNPGEANIKISAEIGGKQQAMGAFKWRVKRVPDPVATINKKEKGGPINKNLLVAANLIPNLENFDFELYFRITSFQILIAGRKIDTYQEETQGNQLTEKMKSVIAKCPAGTNVIFQYIKAKMDKSTDQSIRSLPSMSFTLQ